MSQNLKNRSKLRSQQENICEIVIHVRNSTEKIDISKTNVILCSINKYKYLINVFSTKGVTCPHTVDLTVKLIFTQCSNLVCLGDSRTRVCTHIGHCKYFFGRKNFP